MHEGPRCGTRAFVHRALGVRKRSGSEAAQRATHVSFAQAFERTVAQLAHALARDTEHRADLLERVLAPAVQTKVETRDFRIARRQRAERLLDFVGQEPVHGFLFGVGHLISDEALDERAIALRIHRRIESHITRVERGERLHDVDRQAGEMRQLFRQRLAPQLLTENLRRLDDAREIRGPVERHANGAALSGERRQNRLANPPDSVRDELDALIRIEFSRGGEQADVPLTDEINEWKSAVLILLRHGNDEPEIALHQFLERVLITGADFPREVELLRSLEQGIGAHLVEVLIEDVALGLGWSDPSGCGAAPTALDFGHWCVTLYCETRFVFGCRDIRVSSLRRSRASGTNRGLVKAVLK